MLQRRARMGMYRSCAQLDERLISFRCVSNAFSDINYAPKALSFKYVSYYKIIFVVSERLQYIIHL